MNAHREQPHLLPEGSLPASEWCQDRTVILPLFGAMTEAQTRRVVDELRSAVRDLAPAGSGGG